MEQEFVSYLPEPAEFELIIGFYIYGGLISNINMIIQYNLNSQPLNTAIIYLSWSIRNRYIFFYVMGWFINFKYVGLDQVYAG